MGTRYLYTVGDLLEQHERRGTGGTAIVDGETRWSYPELLAAVRGRAAALRAAGLARGERVALFQRRGAELAAWYLAVHFAGGVAVIVNEKLRARQAAYVVDHAGARLVVADEALLEQNPDLDLSGRTLLRAGEAGTSAGAFARERTIGADLAMIVYTSGSTGLPKGIMLSHANLVAGAHTVSDYLGLTGEDVLISVLPFTFDYGLNQLLTALLVGATLVIQRSLMPADICRTLERERVTGLAGVPLLWGQLAGRFSPFLKKQFPDLRYMTNTGGHFPAELVRRFRKAHPRVALFLMYGLTEAFRSTYLPPDQTDRRPDSMGRAIPDVEILVVDERGRPCAADEPGELVHRGAHVSLGYWKDPEASARVFRPHPDPEIGTSETVVFSGDVVRKDTDGYLYFVGRRDQMIKCHGVRVSPEEIEHHVHASGLVGAVAAFAVPQGDVDVAIVAAVVPRDPATFDADALRDWCKDEMPEYMRPAEIWRLDDLPQTTTGKPDRSRLKEAYLER